MISRSDRAWWAALAEDVSEWTEDAKRMASRASDRAVSAELTKWALRAEKVSRRALEAARQSWWWADTAEMMRLWSVYMMERASWITFMVVLPQWLEHAERAKRMADWASEVAWQAADRAQAVGLSI